MTNENNTVIGGVVTTAVTTTTLKHSLRSATKAKQEAAVLEEEAVLLHEEEKMMHDEEITSVESNEHDNILDEEENDNDDDDDVERTMLNVALMKSVVDQQHNNNPGEKEAVTVDAAAVGEGIGGENGANDDLLKHRLRKRRRRSGQDLERLERCQSTSEGGLAVHGQHQNHAAAKPKVISTAASATAARPKTGFATRSLRSTQTPTTLSSKTPNLPSISEIVPNPLSKALPAAPIPSKIKVETATLTIASTNAACTVPCPLSAFSDDPAAVSVETPALNDSRKVNFSEPSLSAMSSNRMRGFSIDLDCKYRIVKGDK